mmetsp:Transcript_12790/g.23136  ORF Transcript_12790/g.23136 Transcript_12790/m.23136 type:complete len:275 (-) Transcript_12790:1145-1969(-)|eukprot:CAMPEP_0198280134 /NCGR_PEP_ID=MMETSP1449-20131203/280_1 /TAXON_ID=420275 /ORGANISM="Attheya septentrionalis, Strain CCMP2084" /LENGTH=274 /DNA_ID=CAMNT_0043975417 /DNA_START=78 /DNA_END=902 /DNA_ORIENTATION=+
MMNLKVHCIFHEGTSTCTYIAKDPASEHAMIIDPVMDFDTASGRCSNEHNTKVVEYCVSKKLQIDYIVETHVHADHLTGSEYLKGKFPDAKTGIGENVVKVQSLFKEVFNLDEEFTPDGSQFDILFKDGQTFQLGSLTGRVIYTPGHTPACVSYVLSDAVFTGDTLLIPNVRDIYNSVKRLYELPEETRVFVGHDYQPGGREVAWESTIGEEKTKNKQLTDNTPIEEFEKFRAERDAQLGTPRMILLALQVNLRYGSLPPAESNGTVVISISVL